MYEFRQKEPDDVVRSKKNNAAADEAAAPEDGPSLPSKRGRVSTSKRGGAKGPAKAKGGRGGGKKKAETSDRSAVFQNVFGAAAQGE